MKLLLIPALLLSLNAGAEQDYAPNDGRTPPGTFSEEVNNPDAVKTTTIEKEEVAPAARNKTGVQSSGISTEDVNTSPNRAPSTDQEVIEGTTLSNQGLDQESISNEGEMIEAQEDELQGDFDDSIDYSTMPEDSELDLLAP